MGKAVWRTYEQEKTYSVAVVLCFMYTCDRLRIGNIDFKKTPTHEEVEEAMNGE